jgi:acyl-CoA reductase-like NAD-dependent aldehyde dehydrogenase
MSPHAFCRALVEGGVPEDIIAVVTGAGKTVGETLLRHPKIEKVAMTGSTATGKRLMEVVGPRLKKISLELGGHCPAIVCEDADLDLAAKIIAYKGFRNMGQSCSSINRVYAHKSIHDTLVQKLKTIAESLRIGDGVSDGSVDLGPMADQGGVNTTKEHIRDALDKGARLVCGGKTPEGGEYAKGNYFLPTILTGAKPDMIVMREETFGPIVPFASYENIDDAVAAANDTTYGLVAYLFAKDYGRIITVSKQLEAGTVCVNNGAVNTNYGPYAGWKESGYGLELSRKAIFEYVNTKHIKIKIG